MANVLLVVKLPEHPVLRCVALALPIIAAVIVVTERYDGRGLRMPSLPRTESSSTEDLARLDPAA
jgi:hypothetical protein